MFIWITSAHRRKWLQSSQRHRVVSYRNIFQFHLVNNYRVERSLSLSHFPSQSTRSKTAHSAARTLTVHHEVLFAMQITVRCRQLIRRESTPTSVCISLACALGANYICIHAEDTRCWRLRHFGSIKQTTQAKMRNAPCLWVQMR